MRPLRALPLLAVLGAGLAACDEVTDPFIPDEVTFDGVTYAAIGGAELRPEGDGLGVVGPGGSADYGVRVSPDVDIARAGFSVEPLALPADSRWGVELFGDVGGTRTALATAWSDAVDAERHELLFNFTPATGASTATLEYYLDGALELRVPDVPIAGSGGAGGDARRRVLNGGEGDGEPESVHIIRDGSTIIIGTDYGGSPPPGLARSGCTGTLLALDFPDFPSEVCTDYVQAIPDTFATADAVSDVEIRARTLSRFTIVDGSVE
jgi:hypothetical protein